MGKVRSFICLALALMLLLYGLPRFELGGIGTQATGFAVLWTFLALMVIGAHLYEWLGVREKRAKPSPRAGRKTVQRAYGLQEEKKTT